MKISLCNSSLRCLNKVLLLLLLLLWRRVVFMHTVVLHRLGSINVKGNFTFGYSVSRKT